MADAAPAVPSFPAPSNAERGRVPILAYHRVCADPNPALRAWSVRPTAFRRQLRLLRVLGYRPITLEALVAALDAGDSLAKAAVITVDDGYLDTADIAAPILDAFGFPATVFVVTDLVGTTAAWDEKYGGEMAPLASWAQLRDLRVRGWEIGFHTRTHARLSEIPEAAARAEFVEGKAILEDALGEPVRTAAYPYGAFTPAVMTAAADCGLHATVSTESSLATRRSHRHALPRLTILRNDTLVDLAFMLWTGRSLRA